MAPSLLTLSLLAASVAGTLAGRDRDRDYIGVSSFSDPSLSFCNVAEYVWSDATAYTEANNLYATPFVEQGAAASAASIQVSRGKPNLYLWTVGPQGGNIKEDDDTHGRNAKAGSTLAAATGQGYGGFSYVFFTNKGGHLTQSNRDSDGRWHETQAIKMRDLD